MRGRSVLDRSSRFFRRETPVTPPKRAETGALSVSPPRVEMPNGPVMADDALGWLNRQLSWQSILADLEHREMRTS